MKNRGAILICLVLLFMLSLGFATVSAADSNDYEDIGLDQDLIFSDNDLDDDLVLADSLNNDLDQNPVLFNSNDDNNFNDDSNILEMESNEESNVLKDDSNAIYVSPEGNDENDGLTRDNPVGNISTAVSRAGEGYTIYLLNGVYSQGKSTQLSKNLYFVGEDGVVVNRTGTSNVFTYTSENVKTVSFKNIVFVSDTPNPSNPILSMVGHANLICDNCTFTHVIAGKNGVVRLMGNTTGTISNCNFVDLTGSTNGGSSYINILGEAKVRVNNCTFRNISNSFLRAVVYVNNDLANLTMTNSDFYNISGNTNAIVENRGYMKILNSTFHDISLSGNSPVGIIWASETINKNSTTYINSSSFYNISIDTTVAVNSSIIQAKAPTVVEFSSFLNNDVVFIVNNDNKTNITANYNWWGTNQNPKNCSINDGGQVRTSLVSDGVDIDNWAIMTVDMEQTGLIANEEYPIIITINKYLNEKGEIDSSIEYGIDAEVLLDSIIAQFNSSSIIYNGSESNPEFNHARIHTRNGTVTVFYKALEEGSDVLKIKSGYEEMAYNLELGRAIEYTDIYVSKSGNDDNDGLSNQSAVLTISRALEVANILNSNARIHIASGTYKESGLELNGTYLDEGSIYRTIYSFIGYGNVVIDGNAGNKSLFLVRNNSVSFKNIRFTNVNGAARGGAISIRSSDNAYIYELTGKIIADLTLNNCSFDNLNVTGFGGAIVYEYGSGRIVINNTKFYNLTSQSSQGGAIYIQESSDLAKLKMTGCDFRDNFANNAGAMYLRLSNITISNTNVINNSAAYYPGAISFYNASAIIENCIISNNSARKESSAIEIDQGSGDEGNMITIKSCIIENNTGREEASPAINVVKGCLNISYSSIVNDFSLKTVTYYSSYSGLQQGVAIANNNWWGVNNPFGIDDLSEYNINHIINNSSIINGSNITIDSWVILNVEMNDTAVLKVGNIVNISMDFNHVNTTSGEIEELTGGKIPREYTIRINATGGRIYPSFIRTVNGKANTQFTVVDEQGLGDNFTSCAVDIKTDNELYHLEFEINNYKGVIFVSVDGDDNKNGSRDSPVRTIEKAIQLALDEEFGSHEIFVLPGTYDVCDIDVDYTYLIITGSGINVTIFDGDGYTGGMFSIFEGELTVKNLTIVNGVNTVSSGGAFTNMGNLTLDTVYVTNCQVKNVNGAVIYSVGNLNLINSSFVENTALSGNYANGGVIYADGYYTSLEYPPSLNIIDCEFISNSAKGQSFGGGAIYMQYVDGFKSIKNTKFIDNQAMFGGAIFLQNSEGDFLMDNVSFIGNKITGSSVDNPYYGGGALNLIGKTDGRVGNITITNSEFINNSARYSRGGGAIFDRNVDLNISNSVILNNLDSSRGIQIYKDTTVYFPSGGRIYLEDNWWGVNDLSDLSTSASNATINRWVVMDLAVELNEDSSAGPDLNEYTIHLALDKYNDGTFIKDNPNYEKYSNHPFERAFELISSTGSFNPESGILVNNSIESILSSNVKDNAILARIDNQSIEFNTIDLYIATIIGLETEKYNITSKHTDLNISLTDIDSNPINGTVLLIINGNEEQINITDGKISLEIKDLNDGINNITVIFNGNGRYLESENSCLIEVRPIIVSMSLSLDDVVVGESSNARVSVHDQFGNPLNLTVNLSVNNKDYSVEVQEGVGSVLIDPINIEGCYTAIASFENDDYEGDKSCESILTVYGPGNITVKHTDAGDALDIQAAIDAASPGDTIQLGSYSYSDVADINITKNIILQGRDETSITSNGDGTPIFNIVSKAENGPEWVNITGIDFKLNNSDIVATAMAQNDTENILAIDTQSISITDNIFETIDEDVVTESINILYLESERGVLAPNNEIRISENTISAGINPFKFEVNSVVSGSDANISNLNITPEKKATVIDYEDMTTTAVDIDTDGRVGEYFKVVLKDADGNVLAGKHVQIGFNGKIYNRTTDKNGACELQINLVRSDIYTFAVSFIGDDDYNGSFVVAKITVNKQKGSLTVPSKSYAASAKTKPLTATFKSASGKVVAGKSITFNVNGKTYTAKTNSKGVATVNVSLNKKGTYSFTAKYAGDGTYAAISKTAKLVIK